MQSSCDDATIVIVDPLPLRSLGLASVLNRLSQAERFHVTSLTPEEAERFIEDDRPCSMIIYNVGGASLADHRHARRLKSLRAHAGRTPLVVLSDSDSRQEVISAYTAGAQGFLYAGTRPELALQALSFIFKGGSYFPAAPGARHRRPNHLAAAIPGATELAPPAAASAPEAERGSGRAATPASELTERQKAVLEGLGHGDSNKAIARQLGIREGTVKVHVRQIMRKMGAANRTQVAVACANGEPPTGGPGAKGK